MSDSGFGQSADGWFRANRYRPTDLFLSSSEVELPELHLSATEAAILVSGAENEQGIGKHGPPVAARLVDPEVGGDDDSIKAFHRRYEDVYARDALTFSELVRHRYPEIERATVEFCAAHQGVRFDPTNDEEPGKILHLFRDPTSPRARARTAESGTTWPYFGAVDTAPRFVSSALTVARRERSRGNDWLHRTVVDRNGEEVTYALTVERAVNWILARTAASATKSFPFLEGEATHHYGSPPMWKDSVEAYHFSSGEMASPVIASIEVQGLAYDALLDAADAADEGLLDVDAAVLRQRASDLKAHTLAEMWMEGRETFAIGCDRKDGRSRILDVVASNAGWLLDSRLLEEPQDRRYVQGVVRSLFAPDMLTPVGIRTLSTTSPLYRPFGYHNGSVWPFDNAKIVKGLSRHNLSSKAQQLQQLVTRCFRDGFYPEYVNADSTAEATRYNESIVVYRCENLVGRTEDRRLIEPPQVNAAWSAAAAIYLEDLTIARRPTAEFDSL